MIIHYFGPQINEIRSGGDKYLLEVLNYLAFHSDLHVKDFSDCKWSQQPVVFQMSRRAACTALKANLWAIRKLRSIPMGDWVLINSYYKQQFFVLVWFARYVRRCKIALMVNALYYRSRGSALLNFIDRLIMWLFLRPAHVIIANSKTTKQEIVRLRIPAPKIRVVYPRLDLPPIPHVKPFKPRDGVFRLLFVGYCGPFKKVHVLLDAVGRLKQLPLHLSIVGDAEGDADYVRELRNQINRLQLGGKVTFHGRQVGEELAKHYQMADILVSPGAGEGYGRVVIEAMHFRLPVIAADAGASRELVHDGENGFLFVRDNAADLAQKILDLYQDEKLRKRMSRNAVETSRLANFTEDVGKQVLEIIRDAN